MTRLARRWTVLVLLALGACSSGPKPLPECSGPSKPLNRTSAILEVSHEERSRG